MNIPFNYILRKSHFVGLSIVFHTAWDVDSLDWKDYGVDSIIKTVCEHKHLGNGSIILCHNGAKYTADALETLITTLRDKGYEFVPISELIYPDSDEIDTEGRQHPCNRSTALSCPFICLDKT